MDVDAPAVNSLLIFVEFEYSDFDVPYPVGRISESRR